MRRPPKEFRDNLPEALKEIGTQITLFAHVEYTLNMMIGNLLYVGCATSEEAQRQLTDKATIVTSHLSLPLKVDILLALARMEFDEASVTELKILCGEIKNVAAIRNHFAHGTFLVDDNNQISVSQDKARGRLASTSTKVPPDPDSDFSIDRVVNVMRKTIGFYRRHFDSNFLRDMD